MRNIIGLLLLSILWFGCNDEDRSARLDVRLTDAPGDYQEVNIDIQEVQIHASEGEQTGGWQTIEIEKGVYNLLDFTNGLDTLLGSAELPAGRVSQIRLILGPDNTLKESNQLYDLSTPSAQQSGLKLNVHATLTGGITYTIILDFDVARSIVKTGNGKYKLKPVIRGITEATSGAIEGTISIPQATPAVYAIHEQDTVGTTYANELGKFMIKGISAGTYTLSFAPATGYVIEDINAVVVTTGSVTKVGEVPVIE